MVPAGHMRLSAAPQWSKSMQKIIDLNIMHASKSTSYVANFQCLTFYVFQQIRKTIKIILHVCTASALNAVSKYPVYTNGNE